MLVTLYLYQADLPHSLLLRCPISWQLLGDPSRDRLVSVCYSDSAAEMFHLLEASIEMIDCVSVCVATIETC